MRRDIELVESTENTAHTITNEIDKHGDKEWVDHIVKSLGPWALASLESIADNLEILRK
jgi:hypothetical protein